MKIAPPGAPPKPAEERPPETVTPRQPTAVQPPAPIPQAPPPIAPPPPSPRHQLSHHPRRRTRIDHRPALAGLGGDCVNTFRDCVLSEVRVRQSLDWRARPRHDRRRRGNHSDGSWVPVSQTRVARLLTNSHRWRHRAALSFSLRIVRLLSSGAAEGRVRLHDDPDCRSGGARPALQRAGHRGDGFAWRFLVPVLLRSDRDQYRALFGYIFALDVATLALLRHWGGLSSIAFGGTHLLFWLWYVDKYHPRKLGAVITFQTAVFLAFLFAHVASRWLKKQQIAFDDLAAFVSNPLKFIDELRKFFSPRHQSIRLFRDCLSSAQSELSRLDGHACRRHGADLRRRGECCSIEKQRRALSCY